MTVPPSLTRAEAPVLAEATPETIYALVESDSEGVMLYQDGDGIRLNCEAPYDDCDYDGLTGLVVFEGLRYEKCPAWDTASEDEREEYQDAHDVYFAGYDVMHVGKWRPMTVDEAVSLGLLAKPAESAACHAAGLL